MSTVPTRTSSPAKRRFSGSDPTSSPISSNLPLTSFAKIDREEAYHRMHAKMWFGRLQDQPAFTEALEELRPRVDERGEHLPEFEQLWEQMTELRRSVAGATW